MAGVTDAEGSTTEEVVTIAPWVDTPAVDVATTALEVTNEVPYIIPILNRSSEI